jgi:amicyanin
MIDEPQAESFNETRRLVLTVRDAMQLAAKAETPLIYGYKSQGALRALRLFFLFTTLASSPGLAQDPNSAATSPAVTVSMDHSTFIPNEITIAPGTTVTWVNVETMPHTVVDLNKAFRSKTLVKDGTFSFTFTTAGDYDYQCSIHPNMKGKVIVKPGVG